LQALIDLIAKREEEPYYRLFSAIAEEA